MKKVGGPARNEILSLATRASACSGSKRRTRTDRSPAAPGTSTPLSSPEMWAIGAGISTASAGPRPCTRAMRPAFQLKARWVWSTAFGTPVEPEVNRTSATSEGRPAPPPTGTGAPPSALGQGGRVGDRIRWELEDQCGVDLPERRLDVAGPEGVEQRCRHGAEAPTGTGQHRRGQAVGHLPRHGIAAADAALAQPAGDGGHQRIGLGRREPRVAVDDLAAVGRQQRVERRHVPGATGPPVGGGETRHPGGSQAGRHGRAPYPHPTNVTPMSERETGQRWTSH